MNKHPRIIELYGLPGCGKTTIRDLLISEGSKECFLMTELSSQFRRLPFILKMQYIPWVLWWKILNFILGMPRLKFKDWIYYRVLFSFALVYNYTRHARGNKNIIIDHGYVQGIVSLMNGYATTLTDKQIRRAASFIATTPNCTFVSCNISVENSMNRIGSRNRGHGRLDVIKNERILKDKLLEEECIFSQISNALKQDARIKYFDLNSNNNIAEVLEEFKKCVLYEN